MTGDHESRRRCLPGAADRDERDELALLVAGDRRTFEALFARLQPRVLSVARRLVGSVHADAEDVAQETWQAVHRGLATFQGACRVDTWVLQIAIHRARTAFGRGRRSRCEADRRVGGEARSGCEDCPAITASPEDAAGHHELLARVTAVLGALPEMQRLVVSLCDLEGLDARAASAALGITAVNCRSLLHRGRKQLRAAITSSEQWSKLPRTAVHGRHSGPA